MDGGGSLLQPSNPIYYPFCMYVNGLCCFIKHMHSHRYRLAPVLVMGGRDLVDKMHIKFYGDFFFSLHLR